MGFIRVTVTFAVLFGFLAIYARPRFPDYASNHGLKTTVGLGVKLIHVTSYIGGLLGFSPINITRVLVSATLLVDKEAEDVKEYVREIDGVEVMIFEPAKKPNRLMPGLVHIHGGGWALMTPRHYAPLLREIVRKTESVVVSVNYRRSPEFVFPVPLEDCIKATKYVLRNAKTFGIDPNKIGIKGDSAGGNLAAAVTLNLTDTTDLPGLKLMALDYPALQLINFKLPSYVKHETGPGFCDKTTMIKYWLSYMFGHRAYFNILYNNAHLDDKIRESKYMEYVSNDNLPEIFSADIAEASKQKSETGAATEDIPEELKLLMTNPMLAPLMASDETLAKLPSTYLMNTEFDVLRDEGFMFAERLRQNGVPVEHKYWRSEDHGFLNFVEIDATAKQETDEFAKHFIQVVDQTT